MAVIGFVFIGDETMRSISSIHALLAIVLIFTFSPCFSAETNALGGESSKYLDAVREFADNVLKYGRDTYGPKHTPLFVDGLNIHTHEPVKWISPKGSVLTATETEEWILSNFASQQTLLRTLCGLSTLTGDPKYRGAAKKAIKYAFENLRSPNGLMYWGRMSAYDLQADKIKNAHDHHTLKRHYPYYELMWQVDPEATKNLIEAFWSAHIWDWSNLDFNRIARYSYSLEEPWKHEYKRYPTFFNTEVSERLGQFHTGTSLIHAGTTLHWLSGQQQSLVWSRRLMQRFADARHPETGISPLYYNCSRKWIFPNKRLTGKFTDQRTVVFPFHITEALKKMQIMFYGESWLPDPVLSVLLVGDLLEEQGKDFVQWSLEELTAWGRYSYRKSDNVFVPILTDGTNIEGMVCEESTLIGLKGEKASGVFANPAYFRLYATAYRLTNDEFIWEMARDIALGNHLGDIGDVSGERLDIPISIHSSDPCVLLGFLELYDATKKKEFLIMARFVADNIVKDRFSRGYFVLNKEHLYARFDCFEPLALLHLIAAIDGRRLSIPPVWPTYALFSSNYRFKLYGSDRWHIYERIGSPEVPWSLQDAAHRGDIDKIRILLNSGVEVDSWDEHSGMTALQHAAIKGHTAIGEILLSNGADINYMALGFPHTSLSRAVRYGHKEFVELLLKYNVDVNLQDEWGHGEMPLELAISHNRTEIAKLLIDNGATVSTIHVAASVGKLESVRSFVDAGANVNGKDESGMTPLLHAVAGGHTELAEFLLDSGADVNTGEKQGVVPLFRALWNKDLDMLELLLKKGADVNAKHARSGFTVLHWAAMMDSKESVELILDARADVNGKCNTGETPLDVAAIWGVSTEMAELLVAKGAEVSSLHTAAFMGDLPKVRALITKGVEVDKKSGMIAVTALHSAAAAGHKEMVEFLISKGSDVNAQNRPGRTPLHMAAQKGHLDVVQLLLKNGADVNVKDRRKRGRTPLDLARDNGHTQIVEILTKKSSLPQGLVKDPQKIEQSEVAREATQLLFAAVKASEIEKVRASIADGADVNAKDASGRMPIHYAVANKNIAIVGLLTTRAVRPGSFEDRELTKVKRLLSQGMDVNAQPAASKTTLLHYAAQTGYVYVTTYLIVHDANVDAENQFGHTPLDIALQWKEPTIALLLLDAGATATKRDRSTILLKAAGQIGPYGEKRAGYENHSQMVESSGGSGSEHDVAISKTSAVKTCIQGDIVTVSVTLDNRGHQEESASVILFDDKAVVAARQIKLGVSAQNGPEDTPDIVFDPENITRNVFGQRVCIGGDVNGDGFGDLLIGAWRWQNSRGRAYLYFGGSQMDNVADVIFTGTNEGDAFANQSGVFGDVNNDGYYDVIIGAGGNAHGDIHDGYVHVYLGGPHMDNVPDIVLSPSKAGRRGGFCFVASGDVDNDGYCDILVGEPWSRRVSLFWGGDPLSTNTNVVFEGTENAFPFSHRMSIGGDVNGDGYNDIIIGSRESGVSKRLDNENKQGRAYLYLGNTKEQMDTDCDWLFVDETPGSSFGSAVDIFDIDNDGYDDVIIAARYASSLRGRVYVYWGSESFDGSEPGVIFEPKEVSGAGEYLQVGHINGDLFGDVLVGGWIYPGQQYRHGRAYVFYGNSKDAIDTECDHIFEGEGRTEDWFGAQLGVGDVNNDGYTDAIFGAWGANHWAGRAYLYYGPFSSTSDITFNWDTTNASIGKHTLKVEITPVPGEQNSEDNEKTVTIEVKESLN